MRLVEKFGGTSVGDGARIRNVAALVAETVKQGHQVVVVVSALGGVTDTLIRGARQAALGDSQTYLAVERELLERHLAAIQAAVTEQNVRVELGEHTFKLLHSYQDLASSILILGELTPRALDAVGSLGERLSAPIVSQALRETGTPSESVEATQLIVTDDRFSQASPLAQETREKSTARLVPLLNSGVTPIVTGFLSATKTGVTTTLGRGGSDYSATILGAALDADQVWIWTDVDGVMTADPRIVPDAHSIDEISYAEAAELSYFGAKVIHPQTISPAVERGIPIRILNTFNPTHPGTYIVREPRNRQRMVKAVTAIRNQSLITVQGRGMQGVPGVAAKVFSTVAREGINVLMISQSSSEQNICFAVEGSAAERGCSALEKEFELERLRGSIDRIWSQDRVVIIAIVGAGMKGIPGIAARVFGALADQNINVISIAQGSSEYNLSILVDERDADSAVRAIHAGFQLHNGGEGK